MLQKLKREDVEIGEFVIENPLDGCCLAVWEEVRDIFRKGLLFSKK